MKAEKSSALIAVKRYIGAKKMSKEKKLILPGLMLFGIISALLIGAPLVGSDTSVSTAETFELEAEFPSSNSEQSHIPMDRNKLALDEKLHTRPEETTQPEEAISVGLRSACGWTEEQLEHALRGNLKQYAADFLAAEQTYGVNAVFLAAIAAQESGWGRSELAVNRNNLFGLKGGGSYKYFSSKQACIQYAAELLSVKYLSPSGCYFHGYEVKDVCVHYCGSDDWAEKVELIMKQINDRCEEAKKFPEIKEDN